MGIESFRRNYTAKVHCGEVRKEKAKRSLVVKEQLKGL
jgi:hypothetical protein